ncbi:MAG: UvrD-helicase domain-containing protein [Synergistaceae bacterium]|nr:UvrD-helicase domain-containing protein [Synergistaceae bacterium]
MSGVNVLKYEWEKQNIQATDKQILAIRSEKELTVVSAGAGTGKTQTLSQRFAWLLSNYPECKVDEILVLTFTEKAAREMQERIKTTLVKWNENSAKELPHLQQRISHIEDAHISTIHSFAMKVIRESGLLLDIDPTSSITPAPREDVWWKSFSDSLATLSADNLKRLLNEDEWKKRVDVLFNDVNFSKFVTSYTPDKLSDTAKHVSEKLGSCGKTPDDLWNQTNELLLKDIKSQHKIFEKIWKLWQGEIFSNPVVRDGLNSNTGKSFQILNNIMIDFTEIEPSEERMREFANCLIYEGLKSLPGNSELKKEIEQIIFAQEGKKLVDWRNETRIKLLMASEPSENEKELLSLLNMTCSLGWKCWESLRRKEGILIHNDLIRYAGEVLNKNDQYGKKFKHILVDEFQDTDGLQDEMLQALWKDKGNTLFIVGDIKQSIYRFRHADLSIFQRYIDMADNVANSNYLYITLNKSFRTQDVLLEKFNTIFTYIWSNSKDQGNSMKYESLYGAGDSADWWSTRNAEPINPTLEAIIAVEKRERVLDEKGKNKWKQPEKIYEMRTRVFKELALRIAEMHNTKIQIWDKEIKNDNKFRNVKWKDFAILVPTRTVYPVVERAFDEVGIPYVMCTSKDYFARGEVADVINLISLLDQPNDPYFLAGWLASPFSCIELDSFEECINKSYLSQNNKKPIELAKTVQNDMPNVWTQIMKLKSIAELRGVPDMIYELMRSPRYLKAYDSNHRSRINANIIRLADLAYEYESSQGRSLTGCANYMQFAVTNAKQKEEPDVTDEEQDSVQVLTIHASKGLEYPIVALCGVEDEYKKVSGINASEKYGVIVSKLPDFLTNENTKDEDTVAGTWYSEIENELERSEKERLWYVAATRTRDKLILCGTVNCHSDGNEIKLPKDTSFLGQVFAAANVDVPQRAHEDNRLLNSTVTKTDLTDVSWLIKDNEVEKRVDLSKEETKASATLKLKIDSPASLGRISASAYAMMSWCPNAFRIAYRQGRNIQWTTKSGEDIGGAEFGSLAHWILSKWDFKEESINDYLPDEKENKFKKKLGQVPYDLQKEFNSAESRNKLREMLSKFADSEEGKILARFTVDKLYRETPFRVQDDNLLMVGATDIFWEDDQAVQIRDWKTTDEESAPSEYYDAQLNFYAYAIWKYRIEKKESKSKLPIAVGLIYLKNGNTKIRYLGEAELEEIGNHIHSLSRIALTGNFDKTLFRCNICPWKNDCEK